MTVTLGQQYIIGEKPTVILYIYINRHAGTPEKQLLFKEKTELTFSALVANPEKKKRVMDKVGIPTPFSDKSGGW